MIENTTTQLTIPSIALELLATTNDIDLKDISCLEFGNTVEIDMHNLAINNPALAHQLETYYNSALTLWDNMSAGLPYQGILVKVPLVDTIQKDSKEDSYQLTLELKDLDAMPATRNLTTLFQALPHPSNIPYLKDPATMTATTKKTLKTLNTKIYADTWPLSMGGPKRPGELYRELTLHANYSKWRDTRSRRFTRMIVTATEVWPDPKTTN
jgi:hypothetical protein